MHNLPAMRYLLILFLFTVVPRHCIASDKADAAQLTIEAEAAFQRGLQAQNPAEGAQAFQGAIVRYEQVLRDTPENANGALYYNLGNAYARQNNIPMAILNYRRAQLYRPNDANIQNNLNFLRILRQDHFQMETPSKVLKTIFFWHYDLRYQCRYSIGCALATLLALAIAFLLFTRPVWLRWTVTAIAIMVLAVGASLFLTRQTASKNRWAVITATEVMPRNGDGDSYKPSTDAPLHAGTEVRIIQTRGDWHEITVATRLTGWVKKDSLMEI